MRFLMHGILRYRHPAGRDVIAVTNLDTPLNGQVIRVDEALKNLQRAAPRKFTELFSHGSLSVEIYAPGDVDDQTPHDRDELYVVIKGSGEFVYGDQHSTLAPGDCLFVAAQVEHRFVNYTPDLTLWVFFYGPEGGEAASA